VLHMRYAIGVEQDRLEREMSAKRFTNANEQYLLNRLS